MLRILASTVAVALMSTAAFAADLPAYEQAAEIAPLPSAYDWSGVYLGVHGGYGWGEAETDIGLDFDEIDGFVVGGQAGANWQWNSIVFGVEGDGSYSDMSDSAGGVDVDVNWLASVRGRVGLGFDRFLIYGTGGAAFAGVDVNAGPLDDDQTHFGWAAGAGVEVMVTQNVSVGAEYLHYEFGEEEYDLGFGGIEADGNADVVRGRVNVKLDSLFGG